MIPCYNISSKDFISFSLCTGDESETVIEDLKSTVHQYHVELRDLLNVVCDQKALIEQLVSRETDRFSILSGHRRYSRGEIVFIIVLKTK
jgi:hypothetical protein